MKVTTPNVDTIIQGDCLEEMKKLPDKSIDAIVTDPPAGINFMQKSWDGDKGGRNQWIAWMKDIAGECLRVIKPGGHALVWALPRTSHWTGMAWEEAGWEPRDKISHVFGSGFPKSLDISKALDKMAGAEREVIGKRTRLGDSKPYPDKPNVFNSLGGDDLTAPATSAAKQWAGFGTSLKPAYENWWLFQKPLNTNTALYSNIAKIKTLEVELCQLRSSVKIAEKSSTSNLRDLGVELNSAQWTVEEKNNIQDALSAQTDMSRLESGMTSSLNTVLSWKSILEDLLAATKTSTIGTAIDQIIDWRTLNCCLSEITPAYIILVKLNLLGQNSRVSTVVESLNAELWNLSGILALSARVRATYKESNLLRNENGVLQSDWWLFRAPLDGCTIAENVLRWGCGGLNIDACRIAGQEPHHNYGRTSGKGAFCGRSEEPFNTPANGRFPSNLIHDGSPEVMAEFAKAGTTKSGAMKKEVPAYEGESTTGFLRGRSGPSNQHGDSGSVARFFQSCPFTEEDIPAFLYYAKASKSDRGEGNTHSTVKPTSLIRYLCKLITPPGGTILDPFGGSGTTGIAAIKEGFHYILIEQQEEYCEIARKRVAAVPARLDRWAEAEG